jgi:hypothetical protein
MMKERFIWMLAAILTCSAMMLTACSSNDNPSPTPTPTPPTPPSPQAQKGTYVWGSTIYEMGADGAARLAEAYEKTGIQHVILLVKGEGGTIGYFKNPLSNAPKTRTDRDILEETITAMHAKGIKVYAWLTVGIDGAYQEAHPEQSSYHFRRGFCEEYMDVSQTDYHQYMANIIKEIDQNYDVDGFALDYVRYDGPYYGWSENEYKLLTKSAANGGYGLTLDEYNELVTLLAKQYDYPISPNEEGRLVYDVNGEVPEHKDDALYTAYDEGVKGAVAFGDMREDIIDDIAEFLVSQTSKPTYLASMSECTTAPNIATVAYGLTFNQAYTFDVVCPMLYSVDYEEDATWVTQNINYLKDLGYKTVIPSLQAYRDGSTETLAADVQATINAGCQGYLLFRTGTYDIASSVRTSNNTIELTYVRGTDYTCGNITITISGATPTNVTMGGMLADTPYTLNGQKITFNADALEKMADYGTVTIQTSDNSDLTISVTSDERIVYNAPMEK